MEVKVTIKVKGVEIKDLTLDEVRELKEVLAKIVDKKEEVIKEYIPYPYYPPVIIESSDPYPWREPLITYKLTGGEIWT